MRLSGIRLLLPIGLLGVVFLSGCAEMMDSYVPTPKSGDPVTIDVMYFSPLFGPDHLGNKVIYLLKQVNRSHALGNTYQTYFCRVSLDGKQRKEVTRLNSGQFPENLVTPGMTLNPSMDIGWLSKKAVIVIPNTSLGGLWVLNLDGKNFHSIQPFEWQAEWKGYRANQPPMMSQAFWSADGEWIVFSESHYDVYHWVSRTVKCRPDSTGYTVLSTNDAALQVPGGIVSSMLLTNVSRQARYKDLENEKFRW